MRRALLIETSSPWLLHAPSSSTEPGASGPVPIPPTVAEGRPAWESGLTCVTTPTMVPAASHLRHLSRPASFAVWLSRSVSVSSRSSSPVRTGSDVRRRVVERRSRGPGPGVGDEADSMFGGIAGGGGSGSCWRQPVGLFSPSGTTAVGWGAVRVRSPRLPLAPPVVGHAVLAYPSVMRVSSRASRHHRGVRGSRSVLGVSPAPSLDPARQASASATNLLLVVGRPDGCYLNRRGLWMGLRGPLG